MKSFVKTRSNIPAGLLRPLVKQDNLYTFFKAIDISIKSFSEKKARLPESLRDIQGILSLQMLPCFNSRIPQKLGLSWDGLYVVHFHYSSSYTHDQHCCSVDHTCSQSPSRKRAFSLPEIPEQNKSLSEQLTQHIIV